jgi:hypothetical protein
MRADFAACLDPVYADGIVYEGVANLGTNFATPFFRLLFCRNFQRGKNRPTPSLNSPARGLEIP